MGDLINTDKDIHVCYTQEVEVNGLRARDDILNVVTTYSIKKQFDHLFEPFCGHGAIGFNLLENKIANKLTLLDIFQPAIDCCKQTIELNQLHEICRTICTSTFSSVQTTETEKFDLVVGNPPWRKSVNDDASMLHPDEHTLRKGVDQDWSAHKDFFAHISELTTDDVEIFLYEDSRFATPGTFAEMFQDAGFKLINVINNFSYKETGFIMHLVKGSNHVWTI